MSDAAETNPSISSPEESGNLVSVSFRIDEDSKREFHAQCVKAGKTMNDVLLQLVKGFLKNSNLLFLTFVFSIQGAKAQGVDPLFEDIINAPMETPPAAQAAPVSQITPDIPPVPTQIDAPISTPSPEPSMLDMMNDLGEEASQPQVPKTLENPTAQPEISTPAQDLQTPTPITPETSPMAAVTPTPVVPAPFPTETAPAQPVAISTPVPMPSPSPEANKPIAAQSVKPVNLDAATGPVRVDIEQLELGKIDRTLSNNELKSMNTELVVTERLKPMTIQMGDQKINLEVPIIAYLVREPKVDPSPLSVPVASADAGYNFGDNDVRTLKIHYNAILEKANTNPTTRERFKEVLRELELYIRELDSRKNTTVDTSIN